jgi:hypothetical protein
MAIPQEITILSPWTVPEPDRAKVLEAELIRELPSVHILQGRKVRALAARVDCDDALFKIEGDTVTLALVHLTFRKEVNSRWPDTRLFSSRVRWVSDVLLPSREEHDRQSRNHSGRITGKS